MTDQSTEIRRLRERVDLLERMLVGTYSFIVAVVLMLGLTLPLFTAHADGEDQKYWSIITASLAPFNSTDVPMEAADWMLATLFVGLIVVTVLILATTLIPAALGTLSDGLRIFGTILTALGTVGAVAVMILIGTSLHSRSYDFGWAGPVLLLGMIAVLPLLSGSLRPLVGQRR